MTRLVAAFDSPENLLKGAGRMKSEGYPAEDALSPFHIKKLEEVLSIKAPLIRRLMAAAGFSVAALMYGVQLYSSAIGYPINSGGRPYNSWQVFLLVPFEAGVLAAAIAGFLTFLIGCGLPSLHHPLFGVPAIRRATADRFFLVVDAPGGERVEERLRNALVGEGAIFIEEVP
jgi:hypothetical protein